MAAERKVYSRYIINRGLTTLWKGDPPTPGALYRSIVLTSPDFNSTAGLFAEKEGFAQMTFWDQIEFEAKLRNSQC